MLLLLMTGVALWVVYGVFKTDPVIILANGATLALLAIILWFKMQSASQLPSHLRTPTPE
jgi:MtN3 and saliva related transmembrane protein